MQQLPNQQNPVPALTTPWYKKKWGIFIIVMICLMVVLAVLVMVFAASILNGGGDGTTEGAPAVIDDIGLVVAPSETKSPARILAEKTDRPTLGNPDAKLVIVEFSDFLCPVCAKEFPIIREIAAKYENDIYYIYRQFPVISEDSLVVSGASLCAHEQDKFWPMHDRLFLSNGQITSFDNLFAIAGQAGIDLEQFSQCLSTSKYEAQIIEDAQDAYNLGARGTPTFFINGNMVAGAIELEMWEQIIAKSKELF